MRGRFTTTIENMDPEQLNEAFLDVLKIKTIRGEWSTSSPPVETVDPATGQNERSLQENQPPKQDNKKA